MTTATTAWICPTCQSAHDSGAYCAACGERRLTEHDQTLGGVLHPWFESLVHIDGRIFRSCRELLVSPGTMTAAHLAGRRQPYIGPFQLFLAINVVFFITQSVTGLSILSIPLACALALVLLGLRALGIHAAWSTADGLISAMEFAAVFWYFLRAIPRVYPGSRAWRVVATLLLPFAVVAVLDVYRALQFGITLLLT